MTGRVYRPMMTLRNKNYATAMPNRALFTSILLLGLYFPTSLGGNISKYLYGAAFLFSVVFLVILALRTGCDGEIAFWISTPLILWLIVCTILSLMLNHYDIRLVQFAVFALLGLMLCINAGRLKCGNLSPVLAIVSIVNISIGLTMIGVEQVSDFMLAHYSNFYDELLPTMIAAYKPVTTFATHSLAGFFGYVFFFLNFRTYEKSGKKLHLWLAILHVGMCIAMMSTMSLGFSVLAIAELARTFRWKALVFAPVLYFVLGDFKESISAILTTFWLAEGNGFGARYGVGGILQESVDYIVRHPFLPVGFTFSDNFSFTDSGLIEYMLCGSLPLVLLIYGGLFLFLRRNLHDKWDSHRLFIVILVAELGFTLLTYMRSFLLIPAFVVYLNSLSNQVSHPAVDIKGAFLGKSIMAVVL